MKFEYEGNVEAVRLMIQQATEEALDAMGSYVSSAAKLNAPVGQYDDGRVGGNLRQSIDHTLAEDHVKIGTNVEYAEYVEKGTRKMSAQPYLTPAIEENLDQLEKLVVERFGGKF